MARLTTPTNGRERHAPAHRLAITRAEAAAQRSLQANSVYLKDRDDPSVSLKTAEGSKTVGRTRGRFVTLAR